MSRYIFISRPTIIPDIFEVSYERFEQYMKQLGLRPCRLGRNNYTLDAPLVGVIDLMAKCDGAIVLGYPQYSFSAIVAKAGTPQKEILISLPTPWNHIEATLAFRNELPVLLVAHEGISTGVFDYGVTGKYVLTANLSQKDWFKTREFQGIFSEWRGRLRSLERH
jgi:hypothetical protein